MECSLPNETLYHHLPEDQGSLWGESRRARGREGGSKKVIWTQGTMALMSSWQLWLPAQEQKSTFQHGVGKSSWSPTLTEELWTTGGFGEKGSKDYFLFKIICKIFWDYNIIFPFLFQMSPCTVLHLSEVLTLFSLTTLTDPYMYIYMYIHIYS